MKNITNKYETLQNEHQAVAQELKKKSLSISVLRLIAALGFGISIYYYLLSNQPILAIVATLSVVAFFVLVKLHNKIAYQRKINTALININKDELAYINTNAFNFDDGAEFIDTKHSYAYDLDIFGKKSLFQVINRTATFIGKSTLANSLLKIASNKEIKQKQEAIQELTNDVTWRQDVFAFAKTTEDTQVIYERLIAWSNRPSEKIGLPLVILSFVSPVIYISAVVANFIWDNPIIGDVALYLFLFNLMAVGSKLKIIKAEIEEATQINKTLKNYSLIIKKLEEKSFSSEKLNALKNSLSDDEGLASEQIKRLSALFAQLDNSTNLVVATLFNGAIMYNIHTLRGLHNWKEKHKTKITNWLNTIGEIEALNSYANLAFNNPDFCYPTLNENYAIKFTDLGHPLINKSTRVNNSVDFSQQNFIILTGSNMAGKSTFLRSLGINMVLAGTGSPICASSATVHPLNVCVSMRLSDSLNDNESYFFAEVKRLKEIMDSASKTVSFVLLDEILRGTNSDDKRNGTVEVIKKIIAKNTIGAIATHDLKVCDITQDYPDTLTNKCFEVEIIDDELAFDYQLREGICKNKSATFLMKKMEVI